VENGLNLQLMRTALNILCDECLNDIPPMTDNTYLSAVSDVFKDFRSKSDKPALMLLDDHHELFRVRRDPVLNCDFRYKDQAYFSIFARWTCLQGVCYNLKVF
jgi:hypothetical protein